MNTLRQLWIAYLVKNAKVNARAEERAALQAQLNAEHFRRQSTELEIELINARNATQRNLTHLKE